MTEPTETEFRKLCAMLTRHAHHIEYSAGGRLAKLDVAGAVLATGMQLMVELGDIERLKAYMGLLMLEIAGEKPPPPGTPAGQVPPPGSAA